MTMGLDTREYDERLSTKCTCDDASCPHCCAIASLLKRCANLRLADAALLDRCAVAGLQAERKLNPDSGEFASVTLIRWRVIAEIVLRAAGFEVVE